MKEPLQFLVITIPLLLLAITGILVMGEGGCSIHFGFQEQFRIRNHSGKDVTVTSSHTGKSTEIGSGNSAIVPHAVGAITIKQRDGKTWVYKAIEPGMLHKTPYSILRRCYIPFGGGTNTVNLVLAPDGRLYAILPDAKADDFAKLEQPKGFPVEPTVREEGK